jgi:hypothetical protein
MKYFVILTSLLSFFSLLSCNSELPAEILKTEMILQSVVEQNNIKRCSVYTERHKALITEYENVAFKIEQGFLKIATDVNGKKSDHSYCLQHLSAYIVNEDNVLVLHFALEKEKE